MTNTLFDTTKFVLMGEIKLASPSLGVLGQQKNIETRALAYEQAGVDIISVVTEPTRFNGSPSFIRRIRKVTSLPILQKDFIVNEKQIYESESLGANMLLLISSLVKTSTLKTFVDLCKKLGIEPVVEIYDEQDLEKAIGTATSYIAVNARNLKTFAVDVDRACGLMEKIPNRYIKLGFSGIHSRVEIQKYRKAGANGVLVGTALMKTKNISDFINKLKI